MRSSRFLLCRTAAAAVLFVAASAASAAAQAIRPPAQAGAFVLADSSRFAQPELGIRYTYRNAAERAAGDAYVYPVPAAHHDLSAERQVALEAEGFVATLDAGIEQGWYSSYQVGVNEARSWQTADGSRPGHLVVIIQRRREEVFVSFMHLVLMGDQYVKARLTLPAEQWRTSMAPNFAIDLFAALSASSPPTR